MEEITLMKKNGKFRKDYLFNEDCSLSKKAIEGYKHRLRTKKKSLLEKKFKTMMIIAILICIIVFWVMFEIDYLIFK